jgi:hypothetical protein
VHSGQRSRVIPSNHPTIATLSRLLCIRRNKEQLYQSMGHGMYVTIWGHHLLSLLFWPIALPTRSGTLLIAWFLMSEASNVLLG